MRVGLLTGRGPKGRARVLSGPIFSGPVNRAQSGSERHPTEIKQNILGLRSAWFAGPFAYLMDPRSNDQRKALCRLCPLRFRVARAVQTAFPDAPPDILCVDPIRNLFDGGPDGGGENDNTAMMFFLKERVEVLRDHIDPEGLSPLIR